MKAKLYDRLPLIGFFSIVLLAGLNPIAVRFTVLELPPFLGGAMRFMPASILMFILAFVMKVPMPRGRELLGAIIYGGVQFGIGFSLLNWALIKVQPGMASVLLALAPLITLGFAILHRLEHFRWMALIGSLVSVVGVGLIFRAQLGANVPVLSLLAAMLGTMCLCESTLIIKIFPKSHPITTNAVGMGTGSVFLSLMAIINGEKFAFPVKTVTREALIYSIILGSCVLFMVVVYVLKHMTASTLSYQFVLMPFVTLSASTLLTHETLNPILLAGAVLVLMGVYFGGIYTPRKHIEKIPQKITPAIVNPPRVNQTSDCLQTGDC